jgi:uncharacterized protein YcbK (DUF882 family)
MGDLTPNLSRKEFACKCNCGFDTIDYQVVIALQHCADRYKTATGKKVTIGINCGCRCEKHNKDLRDLYIKTDGKQGENTAENSMHIEGRAADVAYFADGVKISPKEIAEFFKKNYPKFGIGDYSSFTHIDSRTNGPARW